MTECLLGLGSNLGDREAALDDAVEALQGTEGIEFLRHSRWQRTQPVGGPAGQGEFLNGAALVDASIPAEKLRRRLRTIEEQAGRQRRERWGPRTLDIDLLLFGRQVIHTRELTVPHPRMSFRRFVLEPACQIAGDMFHPLLDATLAELLTQLEQGADVAAVCGGSEAERAQFCGRLCGQLTHGESMRAAAADEELAAAFAPSAESGITQLAVPPPAGQDAGGAGGVSEAITGRREQRRRPKLAIYLPPAPERLLPGVPALMLEGDTLDGDIADAAAAIAAVWPHLAAP